MAQDDVTAYENNNNIASHQLHSRKKLLQFEKAENISAVNSHTGKTEPHSIIAMVNSLSLLTLKQFATRSF